MTLPEITRRAAPHHLAVMGALHREAGEVPGHETLVLLGPLQPGFWTAFTQTPEYRDGTPDPMDRWSTRVIGVLAGDLGARAIFPFGGPPWHPFIDWARRRPITSPRSARCISRRTRCPAIKASFSSAPAARTSGRM